MSWRIAVRHRTGYQYANAVRASYNEARMTPADDRGQRLLESRLQVTPPARALRYTDYWQTVVDAFDVHVAHTELVVTASSVVQTAEAVPLPSGVEWEQLGTPATLDRFVELLAESRYVCARGRGLRRRSSRSRKPFDLRRRRGWRPRPGHMTNWPTSAARPEYTRRPRRPGPPAAVSARTTPT